jgi:hypothetical protein
MLCLWHTHTPPLPSIHPGIVFENSFVRHRLVLPSYGCICLEVRVEHMTSFKSDPFWTVQPHRVCRAYSQFHLGRAMVDLAVAMPDETPTGANANRRYRVAFKPTTHGHTVRKKRGSGLGWYTRTSIHTSLAPGVERMKHGKQGLGRTSVIKDRPCGL